jgi:Zn-dependent peptidase ImmA (M78 family)
MSSPRALAETLAAGVRDTTGAGHAAVVDVNRIARALGAVIYEREMEEEGMLRPLGDRAIVLLSKDLPRERQRFTIGHELGHWVLRSPRADLRRLRHLPGETGSEEYFCDKFSGALLMPEQWVVESYRYEPHNFETMRELAKAADVSLSAALLRLRDVARWRRTLLQWTRHDRRWTLAGEAGVFPVQRGLTRTTEATRHTLASRCTGIVEEAVLPLHYAGQEIDVEAELLVTADRALALVRLPYIEASASRSRRLFRPSWTLAAR